MEERLRQKEIEFRTKLYELIEEIEVQRNLSSEANQEIERLNAIIMTHSLQTQSEGCSKDSTS